MTYRSKLTMHQILCLGSCLILSAVGTSFALQTKTAKNAAEARQTVMPSGVTLVATNPIVPADSNGMGEYGWGPVRLTDW